MPAIASTHSHPRRGRFGDPATVPDRPALKALGRDPETSVVRSVVDAAVHARVEASRAQAAPGAFGARLAPRLEAARDLRDGRVEVYERLWDPSAGQVRRVTRMARGGNGQWTAASESPCHDEEAVAYVVSSSDWLLEALAPQILPCGSRVEPIDGAARLAAAHGRWFAEIRPERDVDIPLEWVDVVGCRPFALHVSLSLSRDPQARNAQLAWLSRALPHLGRPTQRVLAVPGVRRWMTPGEWRELAARSSERDWRTLLGLWTRVERADGCWITRGLSRFMLPELRVDANLPAATSVLRTWMLRLTAHHDDRLALGLGPEAPALWDRGFRLYEDGYGEPRSITLRDLETSFRLGPSPDEPWRVQIAEPASDELCSRWGTVRITR